MAIKTTTASSQDLGCLRSLRAQAFDSTVARQPTQEEQDREREDALRESENWMKQYNLVREARQTPRSSRRTSKQAPLDALRSALALYESDVLSGEA